MMQPFHTTKRRTATQGFTLIETVVAILILSLTVGALLTLTANSIFSVRYARNQIVANNLAQESLEYIRNTRDSARQQGVLSWAQWLRTLNVDKYGNPTDLSSPAGCFLTGANQGCIVDPYAVVASNNTIWQENAAGACNGPTNSGYCPYIWFNQANGFYGYPSHDYTLPAAVKTTYLRRVNAVLDATGNQLTVTATISWTNGVTPKTLTQSMVLTNWGE